MGIDVAERLRLARVLVALDELDDAEFAVVEILESDGESLDALNLFAKIKHMRGELSQAIGCWAQLHARAKHHEVARLTLVSLLEMARDPERSAGNLLAIGGLPVARKPLAQLELEEALRCVVSRRTADAVAACERLARKYRGRDRDLYKLAVMAKAFSAELDGDFAAACATLEELGRERGFETDLDRVLGLVRIYERLGTREHLEKAVHACAFVERTHGKMSAASRLALLHKRLGNDDLAATYEARYAEAFRRRMHKPTRTDVALVGATRWLPLARVRALGPLDDAPDDAQPNRQPDRVGTALLAVQAGDLERAQALLSDGSTRLDHLYRADLAAAAGDTALAHARYAALLERDPADREVLLALLGRARRGDADSAKGAKDAPEMAFSGTIEAFPVLGGAAALARALAALEDEAVRTPRRPEPFHALAALSAIAGDGVSERRHRDHARALEEARLRDACPIGRTLAAAVYRFVGKSKGLIHQLWADRVPTAAGRGGFLHADNVFGNFTTEMRQGVRATFVAVREFARSRLPHRTRDILDYDYTFRMTKEDEPSGGLSAGLPTALAFLSVFVQEPVPQTFASSGVIVADAHDVLVVRHVADVEHKVKAAYHRNLRHLLLPRETSAEVEANPNLPRAVSTTLVRYVGTLEEAVSGIWGRDIWTR